MARKSIVKEREIGLSGSNDKTDETLDVGMTFATPVTKGTEVPLYDKQGKVYYREIESMSSDSPFPSTR